MRVGIFSAHAFDRQFLDEANVSRRHDLHYLEPRLTPATAALGRDFPVVCAFVNDQLDAPVLTALVAGGTRMIALRSAGFNHVDVGKARELGLTVSRVPAYSPYAVAEHTITLMLALDRKHPHQRRDLASRKAQPPDRLTEPQPGPPNRTLATPAQRLLLHLRRPPRGHARPQRGHGLRHRPPTSQSILSMA